MGLKKFRHALAKAKGSALTKGKQKLGGFGHLIAKFGTGAIVGAASKGSSGIGGISGLRPDTIVTGLAFVGYVVTGFAFKKYQKLAASILEGAAFATMFGWIYRSEWKFAAGEDGRVYLEGPARKRPKRRPAEQESAAAAE